MGELPEASQFLVKDPETGRTKALFPENFVFAECEFAADKNYQDEAMSYGYNASGKFQHSLAGLPRIPEDGFYTYRTNPDPNTHPWFISGAMRVKRLLTDDETAEILRRAGSEIVPRKGGKLDLEKWGFRDRLAKTLTTNEGVEIPSTRPSLTDYINDAVSDDVLEQDFKDAKESLEADDGKQYSTKKKDIVLVGAVPKDMPSPDNPKVLRDWLKDFYRGKKKPKNSDIGWDISVPATGLKETLNNIYRNRANYPKDLHYRTLPVIDEMLQKAKHDHDEETQSGKKGDYISIFNVPVDFGNDGVYNARMVVKHFGDDKNYYDHRLTKFEALPDSRLQSDDSGRLNNASDSSNLTEKSEKSTAEKEIPEENHEIQHSLKRHNQVNPIREAGPIRDEYQNRLDNSAYEKRSDEEVTRLAEQRIKSFGGFDEVSKMILEGDFKLNSDVGQRIVQLVLNSDEFKNLDPEQRNRIADVYIEGLGSEVGRSLAARRLGALRLDDIKSVQAHQLFSGKKALRDPETSPAPKGLRKTETIRARYPSRSGCTDVSAMRDRPFRSQTCI